MKILTFLFLYLIIGSSIHGQSLSPELVSSTGDYFEGTSASLSFSIGECLIGDHSNSNGSLSQGFQHSIEVISGIHDEEFTGRINVYPVPAGNSITISMDDQSLDLRMVLVDIKGQLVWQEKITSYETHINLTNSPAGTYFLRLETLSETIIRTFQIVKH